MFDRLFPKPFDFTDQMDALQFKWDARRLALANLPDDSSSWTDEQWAVYDAHDVEVTHIVGKPCSCRGVVTRLEKHGYTVLYLRLDPVPRHPFVPREIQIPGYRGQHEPSSIVQLINANVGDRVTLHGIFHDPGELWDGAGGVWFQLKETKAFRRESYEKCS